MDITETALLLMIRKQAVRDAIERGFELPSGERAFLPATRIGKDYDIDESDVDAFIAELEADEPGRRPPIRVARTLLIEAHYLCAVCQQRGPLEFHHITEWAEIRHHDSLNMIALCANCHASLKRGGGPDRKALLEIKERLATEPPPPPVESTGHTRPEGERAVREVRPPAKYQKPTSGFQLIFGWQLTPATTLPATALDNAVCAAIAADQGLMYLDAIRTRGEGEYIGPVPTRTLYEAQYSNLWKAWRMACLPAGAFRFVYTVQGEGDMPGSVDSLAVLKVFHEASVVAARIGSQTRRVLPIPSTGVVFTLEFATVSPVDLNDRLNLTTAADVWLSHWGSAGRCCIAGVPQTAVPRAVDGEVDAVETAISAFKLFVAHLRFGRPTPSGSGPLIDEAAVRELLG